VRHRARRDHGAGPRPGDRFLRQRARLQGVLSARAVPGRRRLDGRASGRAPARRDQADALSALRNGSNIELFEYAAPDQNRSHPRNSDIGACHLGFYVEDLDAAVAYLKDQGVEVQGEPTTMTDGPSAGNRWVYFRAPWGLQLELISSPQGQAYEKEYSGRLWHPKYPDR
jgi:catechol 2,3-dioxygenase-like lactoylglutathione lyase family enzyme